MNNQPVIHLNWVRLRLLVGLISLAFHFSAESLLLNTGPSSSYTHFQNNAHEDDHFVLGTSSNRPVQVLVLSVSSDTACYGSRFSLPPLLPPPIRF